MTIVSWATALRIPGIDGAAATIAAAMMAWAILMKLDLLVGVMQPFAVHALGHRPSGLSGFNDDAARST